METAKKSHDKLWAVAIGIGMALMPIHNLWLTNLFTRDGDVLFFLPAFGTVIWIFCALLYPVYNWNKITWGEPKVYVPLFLIVAAIGISGVTAQGINNILAPLFMGGAMFVTYLVARTLSKDIFLPLAVGAAIASTGVIISGIINPGVITGGLIFENNYDIVVGYVLLGAALYIRKYQYLLAGLALVAMFMAGSPEAVVVVGVLVVAVLLRGDWLKRLLYAVVPVVIIAVVYFSMGYGGQLYSYTTKIVNNEPTVVYHVQQVPDSRTAIGYRIWVIEEAMADIKPLGEGYNVTAFYQKMVHNVPLIIVQQLGIPGILAAIAWLWVSIYCLIKSRWKYVWVLVLALSVFDHFIWTQMAVYWWAIVGASTASKIDNDLMFRRVHGR